MTATFPLQMCEHSHILAFLDFIFLSSLEVSTAFLIPFRAKDKSALGWNRWNPKGQCHPTMSVENSIVRAFPCQEN